MYKSTNLKLIKHAPLAFAQNQKWHLNQEENHEEFLFLTKKKLTRPLIN